MTVETESLIQVAKSVQSVSQTNESFRQAADNNNNNISKVLKDVYSVYSSQKNNLIGLQNSIDDVSTGIVKTTHQISVTNDLLQQSVYYQNLMLTELRGITRELRHFNISNKTGGSGLADAAAGAAAAETGAAAAEAGGAAGAGIVATGATAALATAALLLSTTSTAPASKDELNPSVIPFWVKNMGMPWPDKYSGNLGGVSGASPNQGGSFSKPFLDMLHSGESQKYNYNDYFGSGKFGSPDKDVSKMTVNEVLAFGDQLRPRTGQNTSAMGRYQIEGATLRDVMGVLNIKGDDVFDEALQDKIAIYLAKRRGRNANSLRKEWTSLNNKTDDEIYKAYDQMTSDQNTSQANVPDPSARKTIPLPDMKPMGQSNQGGDAVQTGAPNAAGGAEPQGSDQGQQTSAGNPMSSGSSPKGINQEISNKLNQIRGDFSGLEVTSGFRSPKDNARVGGAHDSAHMRGNAVDVKFGGGVPATLKFIEMASKAGIGGIGVYRPGSVHIDTEGKRAWGPNFHLDSVPQWARQAISSHLSGSWSATNNGSRSEGSGEGQGGNYEAGHDPIRGTMGKPSIMPPMRGIGGIINLGANIIGNLSRTAEMNAPSPRSAAPMISNAAVQNEVPDNAAAASGAPTNSNAPVVSPMSQKAVQEGYNMDKNDHSTYASWANKIYDYYYHDMGKKIMTA